MQLRPEHLAQRLEHGLARLYAVHGDEPLQAQEACDAIRSAARAAGFTERQVFIVSGAHFDWSVVIGAAQASSLFAERRMVEIRIPGGKPGKDGAEALQRYCEVAGAMGEELLTLVQLPRLDGTQTRSAWFTALDAAGIGVRIEPVERRALPAWLAQRLARQGQRVAAGEAGQQTLAFFADRVEGNLLAAHQELQKLALLYPEGELHFEQVEAAVLNVARYDVFKLGEAIFGGQVARALRMLDGLRAEGEAAVLVHWSLTDDLRALRRARAALDAGRPLPMAIREARVWGAKERLLERAVPRVSARQIERWLAGATICDGLVKGLPHAGWPADPWDALRRLVLMMLEPLSAPGAGGASPGGPRPAPVLALGG